MSKLFSITSRAFGLMFAFFVLNCTGGGGNDNKPQPPPTVYYEVSLDPKEGTTLNGLPSTSSIQVESGKSVTIPAAMLPGYNTLVVTGGNGTLVNGLTAGTYNYVIGSITSKTAVTSTAIRNVVPVFSISGKSGASGATATLTPGGIKSDTDAGGLFHFTGIVNGTYEVTMSLPGFTFTPSSRTVVVSGADENNVDFVATFTSPTVELAIFVLDHDLTGAANNWIMGNSLAPLVAGTTFTASVQKPGESTFTFISKFTSTQDGGYLYMQLHYGVEFYDTLPDGTKKYWNLGVAIYKVDITSPTGVKTSVTAKVGVLMGSGQTFGPLQSAIVSPDGKSIQLLGTFPTPPVAALNFPNMGYKTLFPDFQNKITVPAGNSGTKLYLVVSSGYPNAECSTVYVDIPPQ